MSIELSNTKSVSKKQSKKSKKKTKKTTTTTTTSNKKGNFADWYDNEIAGLDHTSDSTVDIELAGNDDDDHDHDADADADDDDNSDDSEGVALLQTSLDNVDDDEYETNEYENNNNQRRKRTTIVGNNNNNNNNNSILNKILHWHWMGPDDDDGRTPTNWKCCGGKILLLDSKSVKLFKFFTVTVACLVFVHLWARFFEDKRDETYDLWKMVVYDGNHIALDIVVFFVVGRLYYEKNDKDNENDNDNDAAASAAAVDTLEFVLPCIGTALFQSWGATHLHNLEHSITPYELKCEWTWQMYALVFGGCLPVLGGIVVKHILEARRQHIAVQKFIEFAITVAIFVGPYIGNQFFHLHHWYYAWLFGMHCNLHGKKCGENVWWSRLTMSVLWGIYINGIAIFGRDPILTCAVTLYQSQNQECPYLGNGNGNENENELTTTMGGYGYGFYTLEDLAHDSGFLDQGEGAGDDQETTSTIICATDVTRWLRM